MRTLLRSGIRESGFSRISKQEGGAMKRLGYVLGMLLAGCASAPAGWEQVDTVVVIYAENRSFDHLYGLFPGAEGIAQATAEQKTQVDQDGRPLAALPATYDAAQKGRLREDLPTSGLPNGP